VHGAELVAWLASLPPSERDAAVERHLGMTLRPSSAPPGEHLVGYHASGVAPIVRMLVEVPVTADDVVVDLGAGLGKVLVLTRLLTGAAVCGVELQPGLVTAARESATRLGVDVSFVEGDARDAVFVGGTVFFLYAPFTGPVLADVMARLREVASRRAIVVCTLGLDLDREAPWLVRRPVESFWLSVYDGRLPDVPPRLARERSPMLGPDADVVALERPA
jgi:SAM-dependent methyltransferase